MPENVYYLNNQGYIKSHNYPSPYLANTNVKYTIILPESGIVSLLFEDFDVEYQDTCYYDALKIEIMDGTDTPVSKNLCLEATSLLGTQRCCDV